MEATEDELNVLKDVLEITKIIPGSSIKGIVTCKCGNQVQYAITSNGHLHWHCDKCQLGYHE